MIKEFMFADRTSLFASLATDCHSHLSNALTDNGAASLMVSGGSTPAPLYEALSLADLDWAKIAVALVDERWVDSDHDASNEALIYRSLLVNNARQASFTGMKTRAATAVEGCPETEALYKTLPKPFSITVLGMGSDGHTASLFPHARGLSEALSLKNQHLTAPITAKQSEVTGINTERLSLTLTGLLQAEHLILLLTGEEKLAVFRAAMEDGPVEDMPIRALVRQSEVPLELYWAP